MVTMRCSQSSANRFRSLMLGRVSGSSAEEVRDALGQLCKMIAGNFKAKIPNLADTRVLSVPTVLRATTISCPQSNPATE
ncbi:MAG TPA: chemotaxis protein CheX [Candidatus Acidoferrum sp.]|nr:chemotaxis protein CheX [Candidatus Acidoferrum sp.]